MRVSVNPVRDRGRLGLLALAALALVTALLLALAAGDTEAKPKKKQHKKKGEVVRVMTRNLYLGADLTPAINATSPADFIEKNGQILRDVDTNDFPVRAKGLAKEIKSKKPDLVGLQEASLWRTNSTPSFAPVLGGAFTAETVRYDYIKELLDQLNKGEKRYRLVYSQQEFDFEAPADLNGVAGDGSDPLLNPSGEINGRLTMRDAILARVGAGVKVKKATGGNFSTIYKPVISGVTVPVNRGWTSAFVKVRGSKWFKFVNTHLEAFGEPQIREAQAKELIAPGGPATGKKPIVLVGDLNSDDNTTFGDDPLAYNALLAGGFRDVSTEQPMSCCIKSGILTQDRGSVADFDHHIDHVMTNSRKVKRLKAWVTGRSPANGFWDSDHAGVVSELRIKP